jgi:putative salt-induced outer membrane protein YdiY
MVPMRNLRFALAIAVCAAVGLAQDKITLNNGDVLTGQLKSMADGKLVLGSAVLGDVTVPMASIVNITTAAPVELMTQQGERLKRRIASVEGGNLKLEGEGPSVGALTMANLAKINPPEKPTETWTGSMTIGGSMSTGNTERRAIGAALDAVRRGENDRINFDSSWDYAQDKKRDDPATPVNEEKWDLTQRRTGAGLKYDRFLNKEVYWLVNSRVLGDTLADISLRYTAGAGLGYQIIENDHTNLLFESGLSYFNENYISTAPSVDYLAARVAYKWSQKLGESLKFMNGVEAFPSLENSSDVYFQMDTKLQTNLTKSMIAQIGWVWDFDNTPAPDRERSDHRVLLSVGWTF